MIEPRILGDHTCFLPPPTLTLTSPNACPSQTCVVHWLARAGRPLPAMQSGLTPNANLAAFDSLGHVMAATNAAEQQRLAQCRGALTSGAQPSHPARYPPSSPGNRHAQ